MRLADLFDLDQDAAWMAYASCAGADPESFHPDQGGSTRYAKRICSGCHVRTECLAYALERNERHGIWGGLSVDERDDVRDRAEPRAA